MWLSHGLNGRCPTDPRFGLGLFLDLDFLGFEFFLRLVAQLLDMRREGIFVREFLAAGPTNQRHFRRMDRSLMPEHIVSPGKSLVTERTSMFLGCCHQAKEYLDGRFRET